VLVRKPEGQARMRPGLRAAWQGQRQANLDGQIVKLESALNRHQKKPGLLGPGATTTRGEWCRGGITSHVP
jgi:hypothetical protein